MYSIKPIPAFQYNYIWLIVDSTQKIASVVDPGDAQPIIAHLQAEDLELSSILITHHHWDHTGGIADLLAHWQVPVYGPKNPNIAHISHPVAESDTVTILEDALTLSVLETPGHTLDHIVYHNDHLLFCGDTLFSAGCGRLFEGTAQQLLASLTKLKNLPPDIAVYAAHEYTMSNLKFARHVDPDNPDLQKRQETVVALRAKQQPSLPTQLSTELRTNPFLRTQTPAIIQAVQQHKPLSSTAEVDIFQGLRDWKDNF